VAPLTVFGANSKLSSITLLSGLLNAPPHPAPQIRRVFRRHCALYKFTYLLTYLKANIKKGVWRLLVSKLKDYCKTLENYFQQW